MSVLKDRVSGNVRFVRLEDSALWYVCDDGFEFPVPLDETKGAVFLDVDTGMYLMRWMRKHMQMIEEAKEQSGVS